MPAQLVSLQFGSVKLCTRRIIDCRYFAFTAPSGPPTKVRVTTITERTLDFTWDKPACSHMNGPITDYKYSIHDWQGNFCFDEISIFSALEFI